MASTSSKGLTIGIVAFAIAAVIFAVSKKMQTPAETPPATTEQAAVSAPATPGTGTEAPAADTVAAPAATETSAATETAEGEKTAPDAVAKVAAEGAATEAPAETGTETATTPEDESLLAPPAALEIDIKQALEERVMGDPNATITMIEYASLTCPHCARFANEILPKVKASLIDTGKLKLIYRDYPLDTYAMKAAMMARCADPEKYFDLIEVIFRNQERWAKNEDPLEALTQLGSFAGMTKPFINNCMKNAELENSILVRVQEAQTKYKLNATPTFVFENGKETLSGDLNPEDFEAMVNKLTKEK
ncbi:MAG: thioredoxin domain-containing protein [Alphaproteobacteria bacterium]